MVGPHLTPLYPAAGGENAETEREKERERECCCQDFFFIPDGPNEAWRQGTGRSLTERDREQTGEVWHALHHICLQEFINVIIPENISGMHVFVPNGNEFLN